MKREDFVPPAYKALAFADMEIPLASNLHCRILCFVSATQPDKRYNTDS